MRRLFWLGVGVATGVALTRKAKQTVREAPVGLASNLGDAVSELASAIGAFGADVRAGMTEREQELSDVVEQRSGVTPGAQRALACVSTARHHAQPATTSNARARRAGG